MTRNIRRKDWAAFCREFNERNRFRTVRAAGSNQDTLAETLLLGIRLLKRGRKIEGIGLYTGCDRPDQPAELLAQVLGPDKVVLERDDAGTDNRLEIVAENGASLAVDLFGQADLSSAEPLLRRLAHSIYESRGRTDGQDQNDWFEAKRKLELVAEEIG